MSSAIQFNVSMNTKDRLVPDQCLKSALFTISSEKGFCAKDETSGQPMLRVVNIADSAQDIQIPMKAEAAILNPKDPSIVVLRVPQMLQCMSLSTKTALGKYQWPQPVQVDYWCWVDEARLAIVCADAVYIWTYATEQMQKMFDRQQTLTSSLASAKIMGFQLSQDQDWAVVQAVGLDQQTNTVQGFFQIHCFSKNVTNVMPGHAASFLRYQEDDVHPPCTIMCFANKPAGAVEIDMNFVEAGPQKDASGNPLSGFTKKQFKVPINPAVAQNEFPMYMRVSSKYGFCYMITKTGMLYVYDVGSGISIYQNQVSTRGVFAMSAPSGDSELEFVAVAVDGNIVHFGIASDLIVDYVMTRLGKPEAAFKLAMRASLRGADKLFNAQFEHLFGQKQWKEAALLVKKSPSDTLRNASTVQRFIDASDSGVMGQPPPVLVYLATLLEGDGRLTIDAEVSELVRQLSSQGKIASIENYINQNKLLETESLGDLLMQNGMDMLAFKMYNAAKSHDKCMLYLMKSGNIDGMAKYVERCPGYQADYAKIIATGLGMGVGFSGEAIDKMKNFADTVISKMNYAADFTPIQSICESFAKFGYTKEASFLLLEVIKRLNFEESSGFYQTLLVTLNLTSSVQFAEALFAKNKLYYFDRAQVYVACETAGLHQRAFEFADQDDECLRIATTYGIETKKPIFEPAWFAEYMRSCGRFSEQTPECIEALFNFQQAMLNVVVEDKIIYAQHVAQAFSINPVIAVSAELVVSAVQVFEAYSLQNSEALFSFLAAIFPSSIDPQIHKLYLKCAVSLENHDDDIVKVARDSQYINPEDGFDILVNTQSKAVNAVVTALLTICQRFSMSQQLAKFLCEISVSKPKHQAWFVQNATLVIEQYITVFAPEKTDEVLTALFGNGVLASNDIGVLDSIFTIDFLSRVLAHQNVRDRCDINKVVDVCLSNTKTVKIVRQMLEQRLIAGSQDESTHTAFAKILVETRANDCEKYLIENPFYNPVGIVVFCLANEKRRRDSFVQTMALKAAVIGAFNKNNPIEIVNQKCALLIVEVAYGCSMYRELSTILLKRGSKKMWEMSMIDDLQPTQPEFFTLNNTRTLEQHREMFYQAVAENTSVQVEKLDENVIAACIGVFVAVQDTNTKISKTLMMLLERIILTPGSTHGKNTALHNLLVIAAVKAQDIKKVSQFVRSQDLHFDPHMISQVCCQVGESNNMPEFFQYAFEIYKRYNMLVEGMQVIVKYMDINRAEKFAEDQNDESVFFVLGNYQLKLGKDGSANGQPIEAIKLLNKAARSLIRSKETSTYRDVITTFFAFGKLYSKNYAGEVTSAFSSLIEFLKQARTIQFLHQQFNEQVEVDSALLYAYSKMNKIEELEGFLQLINAVGAGVIPNKGDIPQIADRCYKEKMFVPAKLLNQAISRWSPLAITLLRLEDYNGAVDAARHADDVYTWKRVNAACLLSGHTALAKTAGLYLIVNPDEMNNVSMFYQKNCKLVELIELLESGIEHPQAKAYTSKDINIFTHLAVCYARFLWTVDPKNPQRMIRFLRSNVDRISIPLVIAQCRQCRLWGEITYLYYRSNEFDNAVSEMIQHPSAFDHKLLLQMCGYVTQPELLVRTCEFYIEYFPQNLVEFLSVSKLGYYKSEELLKDAKRHDFLSIDPMAVLRLVKQYDIVFMIRPYLELLVEDGSMDINNTLVDLYIKQYDAQALRSLIQRTTSFDNYATLDRLTDEKQSPSLRKVAVDLYAALKRYDEGIEYAIKNRFYEQASVCAGLSEDMDKCEHLLRLICSKSFPDRKIRPEIFAVTVSRCGDLVRFDVVLELAWRFKMIDFAMPYMIGQVRTIHEMMLSLHQKTEKVEKKAQEIAELAAQPVAEQQTDGFGEFQDEGAWNGQQPQQGGGW